MNPHPNIPDEEWLDLIEGTLPPGRVQVLEAALAQDPELANLIQGMIRDRAALTQPLDHAPPSGLTQAALSCTNRSVAPLPFWKRSIFWGSAAATFIVAISLSMWAQRRQNPLQPVAMQSPLLAAPATPPGDIAEDRSATDAQSAPMPEENPEEMKDYAFGGSAGPPLGATHPKIMGPPDEDKRRELPPPTSMPGATSAPVAGAAQKNTITKATNDDPSLASAQSQSGLNAASAKPAKPAAVAPTRSGTSRKTGETPTGDAAQIVGQADPSTGIPAQPPRCNWKTSAPDQAAAGLLAYAKQMSIPLVPLGDSQFLVDLKPDQFNQLQKWLSKQPGTTDLNLHNPGILSITP